MNIRSFIRVNEKIRVPRVRCVGADGNMLGVIPTHEAKAMAQQQGLDLVEISPNADPPVCRIMDFGKFRYEQSRKEREARRHQLGSVVKEMKFHANVGDHDFDTKVKHIRDFLSKGFRVKASLYFRGRENVHRELGFEVMNRVLKRCEDVLSIEMAPKLMGNSIIMILGPRQSRAAKPAAPRPLGNPVLASPLRAPAAPAAPAAPPATPAPVPAGPPTASPG